MGKFLAAIACLFTMVFVPMNTTEVNAAEFQNAETPIVYNLALPGEDVEWVEQVYTYTDEGGVYTFTLKSEQEIFIKAVSDNGTELTLTAFYVLSDNILSIIIDDAIWQEFVITEGSTELTLIEDEPETPVEPSEPTEPEVPGDDTTIEDVLPDIDTEENLSETVENLKALVEALKNELAQETFNAENLAKILVGILSALGSLALILLFRLLKTKIRNLKNNEEYEKAKKAMEDEFANYQAEIREMLNSLEAKVVKKIDDTEDKRQRAIEAQSHQLNEAVNEAKKNLSLDEILDLEDK